MKCSTLSVKLQGRKKSNLGLVATSSGSSGKDQGLLPQGYGITPHRRTIVRKTTTRS